MARRNVHETNLWDSHHFHTYYKQCTFPGCGYEFQEADWTYLGIDANGNWYHVCENHRGNIDWVCSQILGHLSKDSYRVEPYTIPSCTDSHQPDTDLWLWRYMDFDKFKNFIETKSIFFPKATEFEDCLECAVSIKSNENWLHSVRSNAYQYFYESELNGLSEEEKIDCIEKKTQREIDINKDFREKVLISCWHANDYESEAMWQLYKGENHQTVAISINMCNLRNALPKPIHIGKVSYVPYEKVYPTKVRAFRKHISYEHEKEIRAVIFPEHINNKEITDIIYKKEEKGLLITPDKDYLQIRVYISPWCGDCFRVKVKNLIDRSGWNYGNKPNPSILDVFETRFYPEY